MKQLKTEKSQCIQGKIVAVLSKRQEVHSKRRTNGQPSKVFKKKKDLHPGSSVTIELQGTNH
jgi:hypothetical protein